MRALLFLVCLAVVAGCTASNTLDAPPRDTPLGSASRTGTVPVLTPDPTGQTAQFTEAERAATLRELEASAAAGRRAANRVDAARTRRDVAQLKAEARAARKRRLQQIEDREIDEAEKTIDAD